MKKILSLLLALLLLAAPALAETAAPATQLLTSPDGSYTFEIPADFLPINSQNIFDLLDTQELRQLVSKMTGVQDVDQMIAAMKAIENSNTMIIYGPDLYSNFNTGVLPTDLTMEDLIVYKTLMDLDVMRQCTAMGLSANIVRPLDIQQIGGRQWYAVDMAVPGMYTQLRMTIENGLQYTFSFGEMDAETITAILESFTIIPD